ncbi:hypothetical protein B296_00049238 [Ensete ventricosum]|uniref:Uncharacterized protein n=1 Tax=Ensete ventricosum TaxID=4639 RepID=A0A426X486_ENSVE|nr:hypothetical protein B296_00049238 [Ensete ventricosum]
MAESYRGRAAAAAWGEGMARHTTLLGVELGSVVSNHLHLGYQIDCRPGPSDGRDFLRSIVVAVNEIIQQ